MFSSLTGLESSKVIAEGGASLLDGRTLAEVFVKRVQLTPNQRAFLIKRDGMYRPITWEQLHRQSLGLYALLRAQGIAKGDRVAILSNSRPEWFTADITVLTLGAVTVPIYQSNTADEVAFILQHSGAKIVFAEDAAQGEKLKTAFAQIGKALPVVFFNPGTRVEGLASFSYADFTEVSDPVSVTKDQRLSAEALDVQDLATIIYTSGTTGKPKGARLPHRCLITEIRSIVTEIDLGFGDSTVTFLPCAHVLARVESLLPLMSGITLAYAESISAVIHNITEVKPTLLISVPRIYEKIYAKIVSELDSGPGYKKALFRWAEDVGRQVARLRSRKETVPLPLQLKYLAADRVIFSRIREKLGGRLRFTVSGGAPLAPELCEFFHACGIKILEGYGLTETTGAITVNRPDDYRFGTVGRPLASTHFRIAEDGEILVKGPAVFDGYFGDEAATKEALSEDGWFATGDIGEFDERGFLRITDRKKELIVTSGGKNIAPAKLENLMKQIPFVSQAFVYGDKQKYLVALVTLTERETPEIHASVEAAIKKINESLASYETVKRFKILEKDFTLEAGEMTPSLKLKRKVIVQKYQSDIDSLYH